ncbi:MMPL family transporter [Nocardioides insulae]|uniref:MMPL family transporter n=1 Tax=Nocardioides insulae TaxID=394734 RepID=UPI0004143DEE|nr:MMPL family transporter [Nocardioides insulae]
MAKLLYRLGKAGYRRWPFFLVGWLVVLVGVGAFATTQSKPMSDSFTIPGLESVEAAEELPELIGGESSPLEEATIEVVVGAPEGESLTDPENTAAVQQLVQDLTALDEVPDQIPVIWTPEQAKAAAQATAQALSQQQGQEITTQQAEEMLLAQLKSQPPLSEDGGIGIISTKFDVDEITDVTPAMQQDVIDVAEDNADASGLTIEVRGQGMQTMEIGGASAELIGIALALLILALTFGAFVAAGLPIITAAIGVGLGSLGITAMTAFVDVSSTTPMLATMIGLAVGIDYALFILHRYRGELDHTDDREEAIGVAVGTAGSAVVFAGLTVVIALAALSVVGIPFLTYMGLGAAATVVIAVFVALTLLPAVLGLLKSKAFGLTFRKYVPKRDKSGRVLNNGVRWARFVGKAPLLWVLIVIIGLGSIAIPFKDLRLGMPSDATAPEDSSRYQAVQLIEDGFGPGRLDPLMLVVDTRGIDDPAQTQAAYQQITEWVGSQDGVARVVPPTPGENGGIVLIEPESGPDDEATESLLDSLREGEPGMEEQTGADLAVTGTTAIMADISQKLNDALIPYLAIVIGLAFILLMLVFRSILVPLTATLGFLLSVLATLGATVELFQKGTFGIFEGGPIISFMPIFLVGVVFGLAMDYQVFLVTRIREAHVHGASYREAVVDGFRNSARVVTAAALIMTSVFAGFIAMDDVIIKSMGFALAVAVIFDAFVVRMLLIPALMYLMKEKAWWLPRWLDKILPNVDVEGESLERHYLADHYKEHPEDLPEGVKA